MYVSIEANSVDTDQTAPVSTPFATDISADKKTQDNFCA